jgi:hypothetical protein
MKHLIPIAWLLLCLFSCRCTSNNYALVKASNEISDINCPGPDEAFVTTCSGSGNHQQQQEQQQPELFDEPDSEFDASDLVDEVLLESRDDRSRSQQHTATNEPCEASSLRSSINDEKGQDYCDAADDATTALQQLKQTTDRLVQRYYNPLPRQGKCAIGSICGFAASRMSLGVANRIFRLAGATWVLSEALHSTGFCDEEKCVPEEARPWIGILRRMLVKQCVKVRLAARRLWNQERMREIAQRDEVLSGGFAAGAFIGFVV